MGVVHNLDDLIDLLARESARAIVAERCSIFLLDKEAKEIWSKVAIGEKGTIRFPAGQGIAGETISHAQPMIIDDAYADSRFNREIDKKTGYKSRNILTAPMKNVDGEVVGCIEVINKNNGDFTEQDAAMLQLIANQAAIAVDSALLHEQKESMIADLRNTKENLEQRMHQLEMVYEIDKTIAETTDVDTILKTMGIMLNRFLNTNGFMVVIEGEKGSFITYTLKGEEFNKSEISDESLGLELNRAIKEGFSAKQLAHHVDQKVENHEGVSFHVAALSDESEDKDSYGRVEVLNHPQGFKEVDSSFIQILAEKISTAISRHHLLERRENSQRLATIGQLSSTIVHDFRSPMTTIRGFAEILNKSGHKMDEEKRKKLCGIIVKQVDRCSNMIEELLAFTRGEKNYSLQECNGEEFINEIHEVLSVEVEKTGVILEKNINYQGSLNMDKEKMMRVIFNLTNNALDILKKDQKIIIELDLNKNDEVELVVSDTGPGIPEELRKNLFDAFVTQGKSNGTGLGLHIAREIIQAHHGSIELDESYVDGARFVIRFPKAIAEFDMSA